MYITIYKRRKQSFSNVAFNKHYANNPHSIYVCLIQWLLIQMIVRPIDSVSQILLANYTRLDILHYDCYHP